MGSVGAIMGGILSWAIFTIGLAALVNFGVIVALPHVLFSAVAGQIEKESGANTASFPPRATPAIARGERANPNFLYAVCSYSLIDGPVRITAPVPQSYWTLTLFDSDTENFFSLNNEQAGGDRVDIILTAPAISTANLPDAPQIRSPSLSGLAILRTLITDDEQLGELDRLRRQTECGQINPTR